jgi:hypothetical protein
MDEECLYIPRSQVFRVALAVKDNIASNPVCISVFRANAIVLYAQLIANLVKQLGGICHGAFIGKIRVCHNFSSFKNGALQSASQIIHLEGAFTGIF